MYYKELIRVARALKIVAIVCLILDAAAGAVVVWARLHGSLHTEPVQVPLAALFALAAFVAIFPTTAFGTSLACENEGHLELAWTKPASRARYALVTFGVDAVGIVGAFAIALVLLTVVPLAMLGMAGSITVGSTAMLELLRDLGFLFAWYALMQTLTASLRGGAGLVAGLSWIPALVLAVLAKAPLPPAWHDVIRFVDYINPMAYFSNVDAQNNGVTHIENFLGFGVDITIVAVAVLAFAYAAIAIAQWRRLEA